MKEVIWRLFPRGVEDYLPYRRTQDRCAHGLRLALKDGHTKRAEDFDDEDRHRDRDAMHAP